MKIRSREGPSRFAWLWLGQVVSLTGSGMTSFALGVWVYRETGSITQFSLISLFAVLPGILVSPLAGHVADTFNRRYVILLSDMGAALSTLGVGWLYQRGALGMEWIYLSTAVTSVLGAFQWPAWLAMISRAMEGMSQGRGNGWLQFGQAAAGLSAPLLAGFLCPAIGLESVFLLDFASFMLASTTLLWTRPIQDSKRSGPKQERGFWTGVRFIFSKRGLVLLLMLNMFSNFLMAVVEVLGRPMILSGYSETHLGGLLALGGLGMLSGSILMGTWGGPRHKVQGLVVFQVILGGCLVLMGFANSLVTLGILIFLFYFFLPISTGSNLAIWQQMVPDCLRGRVFAAQRAVNWSMRPIAYAGAGPLVERLLLPLLHGPWAGSFLATRFLKSGGISLMFVLMGFLTIAITLLSWLQPQMRDLGMEPAEGSYA